MEGIPRLILWSLEVLKQSQHIQSQLKKGQSKPSLSQHEVDDDSACSFWTDHLRRTTARLWYVSVEWVDWIQKNHFLLLVGTVIVAARCPIPFVEFRI